MALNDFYVGIMPERLKAFPGSLSELALSGAAEIEQYVSEGSGHSHYIKKLAGILEKYQLKDTDVFISSRVFPYLPLWRAMDGSNLDRNHISELALRMRLLRAELENFSSSDKSKQAELASFLRRFSDEIQES